jgi:signal transduction histidine kinase
MQEPRGVPTRWMLVATLVLVIASVTFSSLLLVRERMSRQVLDDLSEDLNLSVETFQNLEAQRLSALQRENALLARLPSLKALMTTNDERTIADGAIEFWQVGGNDLFALADRDGRVVAAYTQGLPATPTLRSGLSDVATQVGKHYLLNDGRLFEYSVRPLYFGSETTGTLLGYVISGYAIDAAFVRRVNRSSSAEIAFLAGNQVVTSTLAERFRVALSSQEARFAGAMPMAISLNGERYLAASEDLSTGATVPLRLVVMKSFDHAEQAQREINRMITLVGVLAVLVGTGLMLAVSSMVTGPLELLAKSVRAFGTGNSKYSLPTRGPLEVKQLSSAFSSMRNEIQKTNRALLESERLATIGRMASSVSHDLRHYLAAVYANAEFLATTDLPERDRAELLLDIRMAVQGTTELIDSLLIFSRTGRAAQRSPELMATLVERAIVLVRTHPDAGGILLRAVCADPTQTVAVVDARQMERAIFNLLLNACQSVRGAGQLRAVTATITSSSERITVTITDNGPGVSSSIRSSLFEPFVSEGKQNGTGLGLTLAQCIAKEHGGDVRLESSRPGETIFALTVLRDQFEKGLPERQSDTAVRR